jgi:hypothetical protein
VDIFEPFSSAVAILTTMALNSSTLDALKKSLGGTTVEVVAPDNKDYEALIERWSEAAVKRAV